MTYWYSTDAQSHPTTFMIFHKSTQMVCGGKRPFFKYDKFTAVLLWKRFKVKYWMRKWDSESNPYFYRINILQWNVTVELVKVSYFPADQQVSPRHTRCKYYPPSAISKKIPILNSMNFLWKNYIIFETNLHNVIFRNTANNPLFIGIPREVADFGCMPSMNK